MNDSELRQLVDAASRLIGPHLRRSPEWRNLAGLIGQWLCQQARAAGEEPAAAEAPPAISARDEDIESPTQPPTPSPTRSPAPPIVEVLPAATAPARPRSSSGIVPLRIGDATVHLPLKGTTEEIGRARQAAIESEPEFGPTPDAADWAQQSPVDLALVEVRCRLKAASCRLFIDKRRAEQQAGPISEILARMNEMIAQAKSLPNCFLWVFWRERTPPADPQLVQIADSYDALAEAAALMRRLDESPDGKRGDDEADAIHLLAEADSALRVALQESWLVSDDRDQEDVHFWLRDASRLRQIFIRRHMTIDDPADPAGAADLRERIAGALARLDERQRYAKAIKAALNRVRYHAGQLDASDADEAAIHWSRIEQTVNSLASMGVAASDRRLVEALGAQAAHSLPADRPESRALATLLEKVRSLAAAPDDEPEVDEAPTSRAWSESVLQVRALLRGRRMVIIGGEPRPEPIERLTNAFELSAVDWIPLSEHGSSAPMRAPILRPDTAVVVVIIKLAGHIHADSARQLAAEAGKPCVLLSGGYNPERVAREVLDQASERLSA